MPPSGPARVIVTSTAPNWRKIGAPVEIRVWPQTTGADYLIARTGRAGERDNAEALSETLGGLPLAHEQAAAYCERLDVALGEYHRRFDNTPAHFLDDEKHAPVEHNDGQTVAKSFSLAIDEATKLFSAAEPLIAYAALLAPEPIPIFLFAEAREEFGEPFASQIVGDGLEEAVAALRAFALVDRETIADERDPSITTETIRLHRLVRLAAAARRQGEALAAARRALMEAMVKVYPEDVDKNPIAWRRARRLDALALDLSLSKEASAGLERSAAHLLDGLGVYRFAALAAYSEAKPLLKRSLAIREKLLGPNHPEVATSLSNLAALSNAQGDVARARQRYERALAITEDSFGPEHPFTAICLGNLAIVFHDLNDLARARSLYERTLKIWEKTSGPDDPNSAMALNNFARLLQAQGDLAGAMILFERSLALRENAFGPDHPMVATPLNNIAIVLRDQGDFAGAQPPTRRALEIREKALGADHPETNVTRANLAYLLLAEGSAHEALSLAEKALAAHDKVLGPGHDWTMASARFAADALDALGRSGEATAMRTRYGLLKARGTSRR